MFTSQMMKRVHEIAATLEGHYHARLSLAFAIIKKGDVEVMNEKTIVVNGFEFDLTAKWERVEYNVEDFKKHWRTEKELKEYKEYVLSQLVGANKIKCQLSAVQLKALEILGA